jgi:type IV secretion system protein TrbF
MTAYLERLMSFVRKGNEEQEQHEMHEHAFYAEGDDVYISQAYNWRLISMIEAIALIFIVFLCVYVAGQNRFIPYVITIGADGSTFTARSARHASTIDESIVQAQLNRFFVRARGIVGDYVIETFNINDGTYPMLKGDARAYIDNWYRMSEYDPYQRMNKTLVDVNVTSIVGSGDSRMVTWTETTRNVKNGEVTGTEAWEANVKIEFSPPADEPPRDNPLGMYITSMNWTKKL